MNMRVGVESQILYRCKKSLTPFNLNGTFNNNNRDIFEVKKRQVEKTQVSDEGTYPKR